MDGDLGMIKFIRITALIGALLLSAGNCYAARGFDTLGSSTTDQITTSYTAGVSSTYSLSMWVWIKSTGNNGFGYIFTQGGGFPQSTNAVMSMGNSTTTVGFDQVFSTTTGVWTFNSAAFGAWQNIVVTYDNSSTSNNPTVYVNGSSVTVTRATAPVGTATRTAHSMAIGNSADTNHNAFDGKIADFAWWNGAILTANEAKALASGVSPLKVRYANLSLYLPLYGLSSAEPDWGPSHSTQTITGTAFTSNPPTSGFPLQGK
jgi:hypothetical protein